MRTRHLPHFSTVTCILAAINTQHPGETTNENMKGDREIVAFKHKLPIFFGLQDIRKGDNLDLTDFIGFIDLLQGVT